MSETHVQEQDLAFDPATQAELDARVPDPTGEPDGKVLVIVSDVPAWGDIDGGGA